MLVLIADKFPPSGRSALAELGVEVEFRPDLGPAELPEAIRQTGAAVVVVRSTRVEAACFEADGLSLVVRAGAGVNTIDLEAASHRGVYVANCPGKNAIAVAELTMGLITSLDRNLVDAASDMRAGRWNKKRYGKARGLFGRTLALVGFGNIAQEVARRAQAFGMGVLAYDPGLEDHEISMRGVTPAASLQQLLPVADVLSIHVPKTPKTTHLIGADELAALRDGTFVIHASRGGIIDDAALAKEAESGRLRAAVDVLEDEPAGGEGTVDSVLGRSPHVVATPHIGASTDQAQAATADEVVRIVGDYLGGAGVPGAVNVPRDRPAKVAVVVRHLDEVGVLASVLGALRTEQLNVQEMQNVIFAGDQAASATIVLEREPSPDLLAQMRAQPNILAVDVRTAARSGF